MDGLFDPINGEIVANALQRIDKELFEADWAEANCATRSTSATRSLFTK